MSQLLLLTNALQPSTEVLPALGLLPRRLALRLLARGLLARRRLSLLACLLLRRRSAKGARSPA